MFALMAGAMEKDKKPCVAPLGLADVLQFTQRSRAGLNNFALSGW